MKHINDVRIQEIIPLISPYELKKKHRVNESLLEQVENQRKTISDIVSGRDSRLLGVVGPCSIHDTKAAVEYAQKLSKLSEKIQDRIFIVMRTYFEKPRTVLGWRGLILDPYLDGTYHIADGLELARKILLEISN